MSANKYQDMYHHQRSENGELALRATNAEEKSVENEKRLEAVVTENEQLRANVASLQCAKRKAEADENKALGRKRLRELGPNAVNHTKAAYKKRFKDSIDSYGRNRGLKLRQMILTVSIATVNETMCVCLHVIVFVCE